MKKITLLSPVSIFLLTLLVTVFSSCEAIGGIFKAGVWSGVILVVVVIAIIIFIISRLGGKK
ncbi:MAG TPA: hypothetical protein VL307_11040 [Chitinophagaceae bacterium]|jgi:hypothetical protein|nr:hypothetical protein [Chitinophagaceae bacterium]